jgi:hypothetical protein
MTEIYPNLFIGNQFDYENDVKQQPGWAVVHACKIPYHKKTLGYTGKGAPKDDPEYLIAVRGNRLILNFVDADDYHYVPKEIIDAALDFIEEKLSEGLNVLCHCNQGESRAPSIGLLYLLKKKIINADIPEKAFNEYKKLYPLYNPAKGIWDFIKINWFDYV